MDIIGLYTTRMKDHVLKWLINFTTALSSVPIDESTEWEKDI